MNILIMKTAHFRFNENKKGKKKPNILKKKNKVAEILKFIAEMSEATTFWCKISETAQKFQEIFAEKVQRKIKSQ